MTYLRLVDGGAAAGSRDRSPASGVDAVPGQTGTWPVRVHVSEADRSELLDRIVGG